TKCLPTVITTHSSSPGLRVTSRKKVLLPNRTADTPPAGSADSFPAAADTIHGTPPSPPRRLRPCGSRLPCAVRVVHSQGRRRAATSIAVSPAAYRFPVLADTGNAAAQPT